MQTERTVLGELLDT